MPYLEAITVYLFFQSNTMKNSLILFLLIMTLSSYAQIASKHKIGLNIGVGNAIVAQKALDGAASYTTRKDFNFGLNYYRLLTKKFELESGILYQQNNLDGGGHRDHLADVKYEEYIMKLIYVPLFFRANLSKYFFLNAGILADLDLSRKKEISSQTGLGTGGGIGITIPISKTFSFQFNPYLNLHGLIMLKKENYPERLLDYGVKVGVRMR